MNRKEITKFLSDLLVRDRFSGMGKYYASEVSIQEDIRSGKLDAHIKECCPNFSHYYGIMVAIPQYAEEVDEYESPTPLEQENEWKLITILPCRQGPRKRSLTEMLFLYA